MMAATALDQASAQPVVKDERPSLVRVIHVLTEHGGDASGASPQASTDDDQAAIERAAQSAADAAVSEVSGDEAELEEPSDPRKMGEGLFVSAAELARRKDYKSAVAMFNQAIAAEPDQADRYHERGMAHLELGRDKEAVQDFTVALELPDCGPQLRFMSLFYRGKCKMDVGDLAGADEDYKAAQDAAQDDRQRTAAKEHRGYLIMERVRRRKDAEKRKKERAPPVVHRYGSSLIEELDPEEGSPEQEGKVARERAAAWQEAALKLAADARGRAARAAREHTAAKERARQENEARRDRNAVRAARRSSAAADAAAAARQQFKARQAAQRAAQQAQRVVVKEVTEIPVHVASSAAQQAGTPASRTTESSSSSMTHVGDGSGRSGPVSDAESDMGKQQKQQQKQKQGKAKNVPAAQVAADQAAGPPTPAERQAGRAAQPTSASKAGTHDAPGSESAGSATAKGPAAAAQATSAAAELAPPAAEKAAAASAQPAEPSQPEAGHAAGLAAPAPPTKAAGEQPAVPVSEPAAAAAAAAAEASPPISEPQPQLAEAAAASPPAPAPEPQAQPLLTDEQLEQLKVEGDALLMRGMHDEADSTYARYTRQRPADMRVWCNRAENSAKAKRWQQVLDCYNEALAITTPSHTVPLHKVYIKRGIAYQGLGRLQEALRDYETAEVAGEAEPDPRFKRLITGRIQAVLADMESKGIMRAPAATAALGMRASAAAAQVSLPAISVLPEHAPYAPPEEAEAEAEQPAGAGSGTGVDASAGSPAAQGSTTAGAAGAHTVGSAPAHDPAAEGEQQERGSGQLSLGERLTEASKQAMAKAEAAAATKAAAAEARQKGNACFNKHQWEQALRHYERAAELDPSCKLCLSNQAAALLRLGRFVEAEGKASQALMIDSSYTKARHRRARAYFGQRNFDLALFDMKLVAEAEKDDRLMQLELADFEAAYDAEQALIGFPDTRSNNPLFE